jgi:hypothetical protein
MVRKDNCKDASHVTKLKRVSLYRGERKTVSQRSIKDNTKCMIAVDESGGFPKQGSREPNTGRYNLVLVATKIGDRARFKKTQQHFPKVSGRVKYYNTREPYLSKIIDDLATQDITIFERHYPFRESKIKTPKEKVDFYVALVEGVLNDALDHCPHSQIDIVIDNPPVDALNELEELGVKLIREGRNIDWFETDISESNTVLQVQDYCTGVVADHIEEEKNTDYLYQKIMANVMIK